ncbi:MAG: TatD family hydrolase [Pseudomonadota bacterium]
MHLIDSHAHLDLLPDLGAALERAAGAGVAQIVTIGVDLASSQAAAGLAQAHAQVFASVGLHPHDAAQAQGEDYFRQMRELALTSAAVAIGECGLDYFRDRSPRPLQAQAFARQIELALELNLPLVVHDRDAHEPCAAMLAEQHAERVGGVLHCFSGDLDLARRVLDLGFHLGVTGVVTYKNAGALRELVRLVPIERLLLETDCPYLTPSPKRTGKPDNEPAYLPYTCAALAQALGRAPEEVAALTTANTRRLFGLPGQGV